eukprot:Cvel_11661.t1-p1 / transcript=Cvel_11661.t1 / gene=Cvel_11661 / organism=Chromera_velia_CCMP2878 / gene_product=hypothetical protein / transcript_product=hypothetical protein / location=Cvel_scaffold739:26966-27529(-) / protein_length=188 / sequence_SO=supercontig / SO=protein_coding / is_pseudo=false
MSQAIPVQPAGTSRPPVLASEVFICDQLGARSLRLSSDEEGHDLSSTVRRWKLSLKCLKGAPPFSSSAGISEESRKDGIPTEEAQKLYRAFEDSIQKVNFRFRGTKGYSVLPADRKPHAVSDVQGMEPDSAAKVEFLRAAEKARRVFGHANGGKKPEKRPVPELLRLYLWVKVRNDESIGLCRHSAFP